MVPQCAGGLVSRPEPVCASRWLCVFLCVGDNHIRVMWLDVFSVVWLIWLVPLPPLLPLPVVPPLLQPRFSILPPLLLLPPSSLLSIISRYVVAPVILSFLGHVGHLTLRSVQLVTWLVKSVGGCGVTGTPKNILHCSYRRSHLANETRSPGVRVLSTTSNHYLCWHETHLNSAYLIIFMLHNKGVWKACKMHSQNHFTVIVILWWCFLFHVKSSLFSSMLFMQ